NPAAPPYFMPCTTGCHAPIALVDRSYSPGQRRLRSAQEFGQPPRIARRRARLIVVEKAEHVVALALPAADAECPLAQHVGAVAALVAATGTVRTQIGVPRRHLPWSRRMVVIGDAERDVTLAQQREDRVVVPARVAEIEHVAPPLRQHFQERGQPLAVHFELRRQLEQHRPGLAAENLQPAFEERDAALAALAQ